MSDYMHVSSSRNRDSITLYGLDWARMSAASGIAGSQQPELEGCFLCLDEFEAEWFVRMNNTGGPVDVWRVTGVATSELLESPNGYSYVARKIEASKLEILRQDVEGPPLE